MTRPFGKRPTTEWYCESKVTCSSTVRARLSLKFCSRMTSVTQTHRERERERERMIITGAYWE